MSSQYYKEILMDEKERHRVFIEFAEIISSQYDIPHVDEVEQEKLEREYEMRDEVYPDDIS